ncbi:T9SS type A sorting domain-containing protein [Confluentibacter lentus]|uniref:T9SS type A sorting domain-containing protein n=1 Tax=Confluentibacter lentus TaxID=1699412 RepID=UPI0018E26EDC|nr:T9SS type A sorting domain-containing protein [Confluentibacter lentus]
MKKNTIFLVLLLLFNIKIVFAQSFLREIPLSQQIENSSLVIEGKVTSKKSFWDAEHRLIYTSNTVEVYKVFKGKYIETVEVITVGGTVGLDALISSTSLKLREGNIGVFMLYNSNINLSQSKQNNTNEFRPYSSSQGFYKYDLYGNTASNPFGKRDNIKSSFYKEITDKTRADYINVKSFDTSIYAKEATVNKVLAITNFTPTTATAGTKSILTINGSGFGASPGTVSFADADDGGASFMDALTTQIVSWSNTTIQVEIPSGAGTGKVRVNGVSTFTSADDLTIEYSETNVEYDPDDDTEDTPPGTNGPLERRAYNVQHIGGNAGLWRMQTDFFNDTEHPGAKAAFERAIETWRCNTGINWTISSSATSIDIVSGSDANVVRFDNGAELDAGVLGTCYSFYLGCGSYPNYNWYVVGMDIVFDGSTNWNFGPDGTTALEYDFQTIALHELGHGHQLGHVNDANDLMNWSIGSNEEQRVLASSNILAASIVQTRSTASSVCGQLDAMDYAGSCSLSVVEDELNNNLLVYPNPVRNQLFIESASTSNLVKAIIYDINGRLISEYNISNPSKVKTIDLLNVSKGMYFLKIKSDTAEVTKKVMVH